MQTHVSSASRAGTVAHSARHQTCSATIAPQADTATNQDGRAWRTAWSVAVGSTRAQETPNARRAPRVRRQVPELRFVSLVSPVNDWMAASACCVTLESIVGQLPSSVSTASQGNTVVPNAMDATLVRRARTRRARQQSILAHVSSVERESIVGHRVPRRKRSATNVQLEDTVTKLVILMLITVFHVNRGPFQRQETPSARRVMRVSLLPMVRHYACHANQENTWTT